MLKIEKATGIYLRQILAEVSKDCVWEPADELPFYLQERYQFRRAVVAGKS